MRPTIIPIILAASCFVVETRLMPLGFHTPAALVRRISERSTATEPLRTAFARVRSFSSEKRIHLSSAQASTQASSTLFREIERMPLSSLTEEEFHQRYDCDGGLPVLLTGVFQHDREEWCNRLVESLGDNEIEFQVKDSHGETEFVQGTLFDFIDGVYESSYNSSWFLFDEDILHDQGPEELVSELALPSAYFGDDLFDLFPEQLRPKGCCLVMGGEGSRSTLHADPYEWMGWNYLLEGSKLWFFLPPSGDFESAAAAYRLAPNAWDDAQYNLSAGWQSPIDLYAAAARPAGQLWRSARELGMMEDAARGEYLAALPAIAAQALLSPPTSARRGGADERAAAVRKLLEGRRPYVTVQREGDVIMIPPGWWHQTYHLEPSVATASQYTNPRHFHLVAAHMLRWAGADPAKYLAGGGVGGVGKVWSKGDVVRVISDALSAQHGADSARRLLLHLSDDPSVGA